MFHSCSFADVSTSLVRDNDLLLLAGEDEISSQINVIASYPEGFFLVVPDEQDDFDLLLVYAKDRGYSSKFLALMMALRSHNFYYVRLDADGYTTKLPKLISASQEENGG